MLQKRTIEIAVGIFFLLGIAAFALLAIKVSGLSNIFTTDEAYQITADFDNIGGLKPRARVTMAGVTIGRVVAIKFNPEHFIAQVTLDIDKDVNNIPNDTKAGILTSGLLGDNYIGLNPGFSDQFFKSGDNISVNDTDGAIVLEQLVQKFLSGKASGLDQSTESQKESSTDHNNNVKDVKSE